MNLAVRIGKLKLKNPVMLASGTFGLEYDGLIDVNSLGAVVMKTITLRPRIGNPPPRIVETPSGMLNSIGLENKGLDDFLKNKIPLLNKLKTAVVASIAGDDEDEFRELARRLTKEERVNALELNLSCPNLSRASGIGHRVSGERDIIGQDEKATYRIVKAVRKATGLTLIAKLSPNVTDIVKIAKAAQAAGADSISLVNTFLGMAVDIETKRPILGNVTGGLSGPAIKPLALKFVRDVYKSVRIPIIGMGGVMDYKDAVEFILSGSSAVQIGTGNFINPSAATQIIIGIRGYMRKHRIGDVKELIGALRL